MKQKYPAVVTSLLGVESILIVWFPELQRRFLPFSKIIVWRTSESLNSLITKRFSPIANGIPDFISNDTKNIFDTTYAANNLLIYLEFGVIKCLTSFVFRLLTKQSKSRI